MADRLSALDVSFLYMETPSTLMHVGGLAVFEQPAGGFDYGRFVELIDRRLGPVQRYRQKLAWVPGRLANPVWVDDPDFDIAYHVRRVSLPAPGSPSQLRDVVAAAQSRRLDRARPLWEMIVVEGLEAGGFALVTKTHHAMVDGIGAVGLTDVILDGSRQGGSESDVAGPSGDRVAGAVDVAGERDAPVDQAPRMPPAPSPAQIVVDAVADQLRRPGIAVGAVRASLIDLAATARVVGGLTSTARALVRPATSSPLNPVIGTSRRFAVTRTELAQYRAVRARCDATVNDVVLATVSGAVRSWLTERGSPPPAAATIRAMVPVNVRNGQPDGLGNRVSMFFVELPIGEPDPLRRLTAVVAAMTGLKAAGQSAGTDALISLFGYAPPVVQQVGARAVNTLSSRVFNLVVSNVAGPRIPLYTNGAKMIEMFPVVPLAAGQAVSIGLTSYNGGVYYGLNADRDSMPDVDRLAAAIEASLTELVAVSTTGAPAAGGAGLRAASDPISAAQE